MAKQKRKKPKKQRARNRTTQARISFLFQAAEYLSTQCESGKPATRRQQPPETDRLDEPAKTKPANPNPEKETSGGLSVLRRHALPAYLASNMFVVRQKG